MKLKDREALRDWDAHKSGVEKATFIPMDEDPVTKTKRVDDLLGSIERFAKYYFPHYCSSDFAPFHKRFFKKAIDKKRTFITRAWARDHAKSVSAGVILPLYLKFTGELRNMILASYNEGNAIELLKALQVELESNQRLINDFGKQQSLGNWQEGNFTTTDGCKFRAIGSGQSPRGTRNQESRPDFILCDDIDEDELCRNPKRLDVAWDWMVGALFGCFSITGKGRFILVGNIIAQDSLVKRAIERQTSDDSEIINITDTKGQPSWKERFTLAECNYMITKMGYRLSQREYYNNPINEGKVFKKAWFQFKKLPPLSAYKFLVAYLDPGFKKTATSDSKALVLVGLHEAKFHIRKVFVGQASVEEMIEWSYAMDTFVKNSSATYQFKMEEVFLQSLLYKDYSAAAKVKKYPVPVSGDTRKKPDKDARIEATSGYFERGDVYFDEDIEDDHHVKELMAQYLNFEKGVKTKKDGPDAVEGAMHILSQNLVLNADITIGKRAINQHKI